VFLVAQATEFCTESHNIFSIVIASVFPLHTNICVSSMHKEKCQITVMFTCQSRIVCAQYGMHYINFLASRIWKLLLDVWKICGPCHKTLLIQN